MTRMCSAHLMERGSLLRCPTLSRPTVPAVTRVYHFVKNSWSDGTRTCRLREVATLSPSASRGQPTGVKTGWYRLSAAAILATYSIYHGRLSVCAAQEA
jgi:hypothetical protein